MDGSESGQEQLPSSSNTQTSQSINPVFARAKYSFEGRNNDELCFKKGDVVTVIQQIEGGWWEGTFGGNTGWFPSGYVALLDEAETIEHLGGTLPTAGGPLESSFQQITSSANDSSRQLYRKQILQDFLEKERRYIKGISDFYNTLLMQFRAEKKVSEEDFAILCGNLQQLISYQRETFEELRKAVEEDPNAARVGGILLRIAPTLRRLLSAYCDNHPNAVDMIIKHRVEYAKIVKRANRELKDFIFGLSQPFRHVEKYPSTLSELERSMHDAHPDRGDTQRAASVFRDMANYCSSVRKQKEMQLELKSSGLIEGLTHVELEQLGDIIYMGLVTLGDEDALIEEQLPVDRCLVLFSSVFLVLEITPKLNAYRLRKKVPTKGLVAKKVILKPMLSLTSADGKFDTLMSVRSNEELQRWVESFAACPNVEIDETCYSTSCPVAPQKIEVGGIRDLSELSPLRKAEVSQLPSALKAENARNLQESGGFRFDHDLEMILPEPSDENGQSKPAAKSPKIYSGYSLRPYPATKGNWAVDYSKKVNVKMRKSVSQADQEDAYLLNIVEGYCDLGKKSKTLGKGPSSHPQLIVAENEKILVEEMVGDEIVVREKSLVDTVYALKDQMISMQKEIRQLATVVEKEQKARRRLEEAMRQGSS